MNITRENLNDFDIRFKIDVEENDYKDAVNKQLKEYRQKATVPGFRKGTAPMGLIQRMYKKSIVAEEVFNITNNELFKYLDNEKLDIVGMPLANDELTPAADFDNDTSFSFYFDAALMPNVDLHFDKISTTMPKIKVSDDDINNQVDYLCRQHGKFETPEVSGEEDCIYGKAVELDAEGNVKEGGVNTHLFFDIKEITDKDVRSLFIGHKAEDTVKFNAAAAFTPEQIAAKFHLDAALAADFKADMEIKFSGFSHIAPHPIDEKLFANVFPNREIHNIEDFNKSVAEQLSAANDDQCEILYVNEVRKQLLDNFDSPIPDAFLKRWICSRNKDLTMDQVESDWNEKYLPSLKWEFIDVALGKIQPIEPSHQEIVDAVKAILETTTPKDADESDESFSKRLNDTALSIAADEKNTRQIVDRITVKKTVSLFRQQLNPAEQELSMDEFRARAQQAQ